MFRSAIVASLAVAVALTACTSPDDPDRRWQDLRRWEDTRTLAGDSLTTLLRTGGIDLRASAARALGRIGHADGLIPLTRCLVEDGAPEVRREAAFALGILRHPDAMETLVRQLDVESDVEATAEICRALGRIGREGTAVYLHPLLQSDYPRIREATAEALALLADATSVIPLLTATLDSVPGVVWRAAYALEKVPDPSTHQRLVALTRDEFALTRRYAIRTLGRIGAADAVDSIAARAWSGHEHWHQRVRVADALGRLGVLTPSVRDCIQDLLADPVFHVRVTALQAIGRAGWPDFTAAILALGDDRTVDVRAARLDALAALDGERHRPSFEAALDDESPIVRAVALEHLGELGTPDDVDRLVAVLEADAPAPARLAATRGLAAAGDPVPLGRLVALLDDRSVFVATVAAAALGERGDPAAVDALLAAAGRPDDTSGELRRAVYRALGELGDPAAIEPLRRALRQATSVWLRIAARDALEQLLPHPAERAALPDHDAIRMDVRPIERPADQPAPVVESRALEITVRTRHGDVVIRPLGEQAPQMVENFARLADQRFFDGTTFHRVVPDFVVQGGDPTGTGWGDAGYTVRSEWNRERYDRGAVGIAHSGKDTGSCQFFVTHAPQPHLDARYTIWGEVISGIEIVDHIERGDTMRVSVLWSEAPVVGAVD
ncbi:MAG TPA: HEAT repeat domain-containing protein [Candidatus Krumholzibacteria bacterium]|nr:HEAT repeat domain-containing protein [Candidatus Krumholzibacteria bacterium]